MLSDFLKISPRIKVLPIIHGSGDFAIEVRRTMLSERFDCLAVPLPESFRDEVERGIEQLPAITVALQEEPSRYSSESGLSDQSGFSADEDEEWDDETVRVVSYVPIDPCQGVIAALRIAMQERMPRAYIDLETEIFECIPAVLPDPYALKQVDVNRFAAAVLPALPRLPAGQPQQRVEFMAERLRELEQRYESILFVCSITEWPWVREAYVEKRTPQAELEAVDAVTLHSLEARSLAFLLGELPHITGLYERARSELENDENLSIDGVKDLLLTARDRYQQDLQRRARRITPKMLSVYFRYVRNLSLIERRMTPDLYTLVVAAQQIMGDQFAIHLAEAAIDYPYKRWLPFPECRMGIAEMQLPDGSLAETKSRLPGHPVLWRSCHLTARPSRQQQQEWSTRWNPFGQCSWPPEDKSIETFRAHVKDVALNILCGDFAQTEKFSTSLKDGLDIRETLRNWHTGDLYVKVFPPARGTLDCVVMLFDSPADPRDYPWRITWHAEHHDESTLSLFATDFAQEMVGPGIALSTYGGAMFLFPPRPIMDVWRDPRFDYADTLEERLLAAACYHSHERHIALLSHAPPGAGWRRLARRHHKKLVHVPLSRFSQEQIQQLRMFHVLNGQQVRSYAAHFIRRA